MADVSLDEVIRRPAFGRGLGGDGKGFDARQKIGVNDVRQRLGGVKDAREKLGQKDARFKIRGRGGAGVVQDARQMINSRKQGQNHQTHVPQFASNVQGPSAKASAAPQLTVPPLKITKTIQIFFFFCVCVCDRGSCGDSYRNSSLIACQLCIPTLIGAFSFLQPGTAGSTFSMSAPITKVVKNDAYTAPRPAAPVGSARPNTSLAPAFSPLEGTKITVNNLHPRVTEEDIVELFCVCGALKRARLVKVGVAEVVFVRKEDAVSAYRKYNNRCLDGQPMKCNLHIQGNVITSDQPILLRLSDTPGTGSSTKKEGLPPSLSRPTGQRSSSQPTPEVDPQTILKALFKSTTQSPSTTEPPSSQATAFRIKI
uniref:DNA polymerase delta interacting protein 3 n=1 Tax=Amphilophus citrinellus TaxID=61819 RepID=A0A3Q0T1F2_AMPCI